MKPVSFELLSSSPSIRRERSDLSLCELEARVLSADQAAGRPGFRHTDAELIQIVPSRGSKEPRYFVQFVPNRASRPKHPSGCPICLPQVQSVEQSYAIIRVGSTDLAMLANPFAYMPSCITWAAAEDLPQRCGTEIDQSSWATVLMLMLNLCHQLGDHVVGFNELAGNSLDHLHLVSHKPIPGIGLYGVQQSATRLAPSDRLSVFHLGAEQGYPIDAWRIGLPDDQEAVEAGTSLVAQWRSIGGPSASANCAAVMEDGHPVLYLFPRSTLLRAWGWSSSPAILEMMGVFIECDAEEMVHVRSGLWGHEHFSQILSSLRPPWLRCCD